MTAATASGFQSFQVLFRFLARKDEADPAVVASGALERGLAVTAAPYAWHVSGWRQNVDGRYPEEASVVLGRAGLPDPGEEVEHLVCPATPVVKAEAQNFELLPEPSDAYTKRQPSTREIAHGRDLASGVDSVAH